MLDRRLWAAVEHIPTGEEGMGVECVLNLPGVPQLEGRSFQALLVRQPVNFGGCGLRSMVETRLPAFIGGAGASPSPHGGGGESEDTAHPTPSTGYRKYDWATALG